MKFIKLYHYIWTLNLSPNAFITYCALLSFMNLYTYYSNVSMRKLAASVCLSEKSIARGIRELEEKQLLSVVAKYHNGHRIANGYKISPLSGKFTMIPVGILSAPLTACGFKIFAYLRKCSDTHKKAFPSYSHISNVIGITVKTIIEQVKVMVSLKLINKQHQTKKDGSFGHNLYHVFEEFTQTIKKERTRLERVSPQKVAIATTPKCKYSLRPKTIFVNSLRKIKSVFEEVFYKFVRASNKTIFKQ